MKSKMYTGLLMCLLCATVQAQHRILVGGYFYKELAVFAADGSKEWACTEDWEVSDARLLPNQDIVLAYKFGVRLIRPDWSSAGEYEEIYNRPTPEGGETHSCQPLPDGGFLTGESFNGVSYIIELDASFNERKRIELKGLGGKHTTFRQLSKTPQNTYLVTQYDLKGTALELDSNGGIIRRFADGHFVAVRLENGNTLISCGENHRIIEVDPNDHVVWSVERDELPDTHLGLVTSVSRLANGNTIFCNWGGHASRMGPTKGASIIEVTPDKKIVWEFTEGVANRIATVQVLACGKMEPATGLRVQTSCLISK